jgi:nucleotide-binding universal stress UspA family protein
MNMKKILFPTDFSTLSDEALAQATSLARDSGAKLIIVHVQEPPTAYGGGEMYYGVPEPDTEAIEKMLKAIVPKDPEVSYEHRLVMGDPAAEIERIAEEEDVDLIIMATHGRTGLTRLLMGSVAEAVVRRAPCPVFSFKRPHKEAVGQEGKK